MGKEMEWQALRSKSCLRCWGVHDCAQDMLYKEVRRDSCALIIFNRLTKELPDDII